MSDFLDILDNHRELLQERGYDEIGLGSPDDPGLFMRKLEFLFSECVRKSEYNNQKQDFFIEAYGFFNDDNDVVSFKFHYEFDPTTKDIELKSISARLDEYSKVFLFSRNTYELPYASRVYQILNSAKQSNEVGLNPQDVIDKMVNEQDDLLKQLGYYKTLFANPSDFIRHELKSELKKLSGYQLSEIQHISIKRYIHFDSYQNLHCSFNYQYNPLNKTLHLESIDAKNDNIERHFSIANIHTSITLQQIHQSLKEAERVSFAKQLAEHFPGKSNKMKL